MSAVCLEKTVRTIQSVKLDQRPGAVHHYATINYDVLELIIEKTTGITYEKYIEQNVLEPLGMHDSHFRVDDSKTNRSAQGYRYAFMRAAKYDAPAFDGNTAAGYLISNPKDLMIWMRAQMGIFETDRTESLEKLEKLAEAIMESHTYPVEDGQHYWAGWNLYDTYFSRTGNNPNFFSQVIMDQEETKAVFAPANIYGSVAAMTADGIYRMLHGEKVRIGFFADEISPAVWYSPCLLAAMAGGVICLSGYAVECFNSVKGRLRDKI